MYQADTSIIQRSNVQTDVLVINQCNENRVQEFTFTNKDGKVCKAKFINTTERGLSRSRNMAINNAWGDICLLCDDDEVLIDNYCDVIESGYYKYSNADVCLFDIIRNEKDGMISSTGDGQVGFIGILKSCSVQISFKRASVMKKGILFDTEMGSGTSNGAGEENKFLMDCKHNKLALFSCDVVIGSIMNQGKSQWFQSYNERYFLNKGWESKKWGGVIIGFFYIWYSTIKHGVSESKDGISIFKQLILKHKGFFDKRTEKK